MLFYVYTCFYLLLQKKKEKKKKKNNRQRIVRFTEFQRILEKICANTFLRYVIRKSEYYGGKLAFVGSRD